MKKYTFVTLVLVTASFVSCIISCSDNKAKNSPVIANATQLTNEDMIKQGEYLVKIMGCNDCHSPKKMSSRGPEIIPELMLSGYPSDRPIVKFDNKLIKSGFSLFYPDLTAAAGPWGISFASNLTPDDSGIGNWTEEQFSRAITQGKSKGLEGNRLLLPPMPWPNYTALSDKDLKGIFAYLKSIKPVKNRVPDAISADKL